MPTPLISPSIYTGGEGSPGTFGGANGLVTVDDARVGNTYDFKTITANASANTKGNYTEIITASSAAASMVVVRVSSTAASATNTGVLVDIATGTAGNEVVLIPDLLAGWRAVAPLANGSFQPSEWWFPVFVAAGTRISARQQSVVAGGATALVAVSLYSGGACGTAVDSIGVTAASSKGVDVVCGLSGAAGTYTQITAATSAAYKYILWSAGGAADTTMVADIGILDIGVGAPASEVGLITNQGFNLGGTEILQHQVVRPVASSAAVSGVRLAARASIAGAGAQSIDVALYGVR